MDIYVLLAESSETFHLPKLCSSAVVVVLNLLGGHGIESFGLFLNYYTFKSQEAKKYFVVEQCWFSPPAFVVVIFS